MQLRKDKKEDSLQKRRRDRAARMDEDRQVGALPDPQHKKNLETIPADIIALNSDEPQTQLDAATRFRKLLSIERNPPIAEVIAAGAVPRLVQYCQCYDNPALLLEAAWTLTNISSGTSEHTRVVIDNGAVPVFCFLLQYSNHEVQEQGSVEALGNIAGDSPRTRDLVLSYSALPQLLAQLHDGTSCRCCATRRGRSPTSAAASRPRRGPRRRRHPGAHAPHPLRRR